MSSLGGQISPPGSRHESGGSRTLTGPQDHQGDRRAPERARGWGRARCAAGSPVAISRQHRCYRHPDSVRSVFRYSQTVRSSRPARSGRAGLRRAFRLGHGAGQSGGGRSACSAGVVTTSPSVPEGQELLQPGDDLQGGVQGVGAGRSRVGFGTEAGDHATRGRPVHHRVRRPVDTAALRRAPRPPRSAPSPRPAGSTGPRRPSPASRRHRAAPSTFAAQTRATSPAPPTFSPMRSSGQPSPPAARRPRHHPPCSAPPRSCPATLPVTAANMPNPRTRWWSKTVPFQCPTGTPNRPGHQVGPLPGRGGPPPHPGIHRPGTAGMLSASVHPSGACRPVHNKAPKGTMGDRTSRPFDAGFAQQQSRITNREVNIHGHDQGPPLLRRCRAARRK